MEIVLAIYLAIGLIYGGFITAGTWDSWRGGRTPIMNGVVSGIFWPLVFLWIIISP